MLSGYCASKHRREGGWDAETPSRGKDRAGRSTAGESSLSSWLTLFSNNNKLSARLSPSAPLLLPVLSSLCFMGAVCGCCTEPVNFDGEVDLFHFDLHRAVGKGAFGKVRTWLIVSVLLFTPSDLPLARLGSCRRAQTVQETLCPQIHRQGKMHQAEGNCQHHPGETAIGGGTYISHPRPRPPRF